VTTLAVFHIKGGVGKTAASVNLSYLAAQSGAQTLLCDLDPQGAATYYFRIKPKVKAAEKIFLKGGKHIVRNIKGTDYEHLDLLPADISYRRLAVALELAKQSKQRLRTILEPLRHAYTYIILDCPPNMTRIAENVFIAADYLIVPVIPSTLALRAYTQLLTFFDDQGYDKGKIVAFFSMVEKKKKMHRDIMHDMSAQSPQLLRSTVPYLADIEKMGVYREPVLAFAPHALASRAYRALWAEIQERVHAGNS
jgi:cellulose biosynthesis protein BcsQ